MSARAKNFLLATAALCVCVAVALSQAGRHTNSVAGAKGATLLNVTAARTDGSTDPVAAKDVALYDDGSEQQLVSFTPDPSPARIVLLIDNSASLRTDVPKLAQVPREFAYEIYDGDKVLLVGYNENAETLGDWTDDPKQIEASLKTLYKKGEPHLFDALQAVVDDALAPYLTNRKRVVVLVGDGLDRGSKTKFKDILAALQQQDITVYALEIPDRTGGAHRRDTPKPSEVVRQLAEGTGGRVLPLKEPRAAAKMICDELRKNRYILAYNPSNVTDLTARRLMILANDGINARTKTAQPARQ